MPIVVAKDSSEVAVVVLGVAAVCRSIAATRQEMCAVCGKMIEKTGDRMEGHEPFLHAIPSRK